MNDRFKFRCYNRKTKKMYEVDSLHLDSENEWVWVHYYNPIYDKDLKIQIEQPNAIIMQSTGLKDKNGKLIYEKDFVKNFDNRIYQVFWIDDAACFMVVNIKTKTIQGIHSLISLKNDLEVIGNIYENKEL